jgi:hypothetical protein
MEDLIEVGREVWFVVGLVAVATAWVVYAEHPTAQNLRVAIGDTFNL